MTSNPLFRPGVFFFVFFCLFTNATISVPTTSTSNRYGAQPMHYIGWAPRYVVFFICLPTTNTFFRFYSSNNADTTIPSQPQHPFDTTTTNHLPNLATTTTYAPLLDHNANKQVQGPNKKVLFFSFVCLLKCLFQVIILHQVCIISSFHLSVTYHENQ